MRRLIIAVMLPLLFSGCATQTRTAALTDTLQIYAATLRWSDWAQAAVLMDPESIKLHPVSSLELERIHQYRVTGYHDSGPVIVKPGEAQVIAEINLVNLHTQEERSVIDHQTWHYDDKSKRWLLTSGLPNIAPHS